MYDGLVELVNGERLNILPAEILEAAKERFKQEFIIGYLPLDSSDIERNFARRYHRDFQLGRRGNSRYGLKDEGYKSGVWLDIHSAKNDTLFILSSPSVDIGPYSINGLPALEKLAKSYNGKINFFVARKALQFFRHRIANWILQQGNLDANVETLGHEDGLIKAAYLKGILDPGSYLVLSVPGFHSKSLVSDKNIGELIAQYVQGVRSSADKKIAETARKIEELTVHRYAVELDHLDLQNLPDNFKFVQAGCELYCLDFTRLGEEYLRLLDAEFRSDMRLGPHGLVHIDEGNLGPSSQLKLRNIKDNLRFRVKAHKISSTSENPGCATFSPVTFNERNLSRVARALSLGKSGALIPEAYSPSLLIYLFKHYDNKSTDGV